MYIEPIAVYDAFSFTNQDTGEQWTIQGPLSGDLVAGLLVGMHILITNMLVNSAYVYNTPNIVEIISKTGIIRAIFYHATNINSQPNKILRNYMTNFNSADGLTVHTHGIFGWWLYSPMNAFSYDLYIFESADFVQGFVSMCRAFGVDFRNFTLGPPYKFYVEDMEPRYYEVEGYDIEPIPIVKRRAPVGPFYTNVYEADPDAVDFI